MEPAGLGVGGLAGAFRGWGSSRCTGMPCGSGSATAIRTPMLIAVYAALKPFADGPPQAATA